MTGKILENPQVYTSYLSLGSNEGDREMNIQSAVEKIGALDGTCVEAVSSIIETTPSGKLERKTRKGFPQLLCTYFHIQDTIPVASQSQGNRMLLGQRLFGNIQCSRFQNIQ